MAVLTEFFVVGGDTLVLVDRLRDRLTGEFLSDETVNLEVLDSLGVAIVAETPMTFVGGNTNGRYQLSVADPGFVTNAIYTLIITTTAGGRDFRGTRAMPAKPFSF